MLHVYGEDGRELLVRRLPRGAADDEVASADGVAVSAALGPGEALCIVIYDGDSGERITPLGQGHFHPPWSG